MKKSLDPVNDNDTSKNDTSYDNNFGNNNNNDDNDDKI